MRTVQTHLNLAPDDRPGAVAAIGNFDGVHLGHQAVINTARAAAHTAGAPLAIVTFEPHPRQVFAPDAPPFRLMNAAAKANRLAKLGIDILYEIPFSKDLAALTPDRFVTDVLANGLGLSHVVVGADFCFGQNRSGSVEDLQRLGPQLGFGVTIQPLMAFQGMDVSSTRIREALAHGRPRDAADMLGHNHRIEGQVIKGDQRGRDLGYPTANLGLEGLHPPRFGVYAVAVDVLTGDHKGRYHGVASLGVRPMFGINTPNFETHIFDFNGDLYGAHISVALVEFLRDEAKFGSLDALISQMNADSAAARSILT
ncbi:MAG: bifunctional riboflavin kinase/FAD synthetase [Pseudomonadota bacterium]